MSQKDHSLDPMCELAQTGPASPFVGRHKYIVLVSRLTFVLPCTFKMFINPTFTDGSAYGEL